MTEEFFGRIDTWALNGDFESDDCYYCHLCRTQWMTPQTAQYCPGCGEEVTKITKSS